ncbi:type II secretion system F family protein [Magnetococcales bacterium HHB-1]
MAHVQQKHLLIFCNQFSSMIRSQLPLVEVLGNLADETPNKDLQQVIDDVLADVESGVDFADALANHPEVFDDIFVSIVRAGMSAGKLGEALAQLVVYLEKVDEVNRKVKGAVSYPIIMLLAFFGVFNAMVFFILPRFESMFLSMNKELPLPTQILLDVGRFWGDSWYLILSGIGLVIFSFVVWTSTDEGKSIWDEYKIGFPVIGNLWRMAALSRFLRTFSVQLQNEVPLLDALNLAAPAAGNLYVENALYDIADNIERGASVADAFRMYEEFFAGIVLQMIASGEEAGAIDELLLSAADYFETLLDDQINHVTGLINPILTVFMGMSILGMMVAAFLPVFDMGSAMS